MSVAVASSIYKPLADRDYNKICRLMEFLRSVYKIIAICILLIGCIFSLYIPIFFKDENFSLIVIYSAFYSFLIPVILEYLYNHREIILSADRKNYIKTYIRDGLHLVKAITQLIVLKIGGGVYSWLVVGIVTTVVSICLINRYINNNYTWLKLEKVSFKDQLKSKEIRELLVKVKQQIFHKISNVILHSSDKILFFKFSDLTTVAVVGNFQILVNMILTGFGKLTMGVTPAIGNYTHTVNSQKNLILFKFLLQLYGGVAFVFSGLFYVLSDPFVSVWLGDSYKISSDVKVALAVNMFILIFRSAIDSYIIACGLFQDVKASVFQAVLNLVLSIFLGYYYSIVGVLVGTIISTLVIVIIWRPYLLYLHVFNQHYLKYMYELIKIILPITILSILLYMYIPLELESKSIFSFILYFIKSVSLFIGLFVLLLILNREFVKTIINYRKTRNC